jgi:hypothetical protein
MLTAERLREVLDYERETGLFRWRIYRSRGARAGDLAGSLKRHGYVLITIDGVSYYAHRLVWFHEHGRWPSGMIDHLDGVRSNNRIGNMRDTTQYVNQQNRATETRCNGSGFIGAFRHGRRWMSKIMANGVLHKLGTFDTPEQAHAAYVSAKRTLHQGRGA